MKSTRPLSRAAARDGVHTTELPLDLPLATPKSLGGLAHVQTFWCKHSGW